MKTRCESVDSRKQTPRAAMRFGQHGFKNAVRKREKPKARVNV